VAGGWNENHGVPLFRRKEIGCRREKHHHLINIETGDGHDDNIKNTLKKLVHKNPILRH
jgi:hypothetical protein